MQIAARSFSSAVRAAAARPSRVPVVRAFKDESPKPAKPAAKPAKTAVNADKEPSLRTQSAFDLYRSATFKTLDASLKPTERMKVIGEM
jgi:hypothetical protein